jgi:GGDEF domain-containing protein
VRERILSMIDLNNQFYAGRSGHVLSLSIGAATCEVGEPLEAALMRADKAMYRNKALHYETHVKHRSGDTPPPMAAV